MMLRLALVARRSGDTSQELAEHGRARRGIRLATHVALEAQPPFVAGTNPEPAKTESRLGLGQGTIAVVYFGDEMKGWEEREYGTGSSR